MLMPRLSARDREICDSEIGRVSDMNAESATLLAHHASRGPTPIGSGGRRIDPVRARRRAREPLPRRNWHALTTAGHRRSRAASRFDGPTPEIGKDPVQAIDALNAAADPGLTGSAGPRFFGWVIGASAPVGVAADMLTSAWGQNAGNYACSPAAAVAEKVAARWLLDILRLPPDVRSASSPAPPWPASCAWPRRNAVLERIGWDVEVDGLTGAPPMRVFVGERRARDCVRGAALSRLRRAGNTCPHRRRRPYGRTRACRPSPGARGPRSSLPRPARSIPGHSTRSTASRGSAASTAPGCTSTAPSAFGP